MAEMLEATIAGTDGESLRRRILAYLERSEFDDQLDTLVASPHGGIDELAPFTDEIVSPNHAVALRGAVTRFLESYPDVPGLLLLRALAEALAPDCRTDVVVENIEAALGFGRDQYNLAPALLGEALVRVAVSASKRPGSAERIVVAALSQRSTDRPFAREVARQLPPSLAVLPAVWLSRRLIRQSAGMLTY